MTNDQDSPPRGRICLTCADWDVRILRDRSLADSVAYCLRASSLAFHQVVSGSCGCDAWRPANEETEQSPTG